MDVDAREQMNQQCSSEQNLNMDLLFELIFPYLAMPDLVKFIRAS